MNLTLSKRRKEAGLTQSDLAQILDITQGQVSKYEASGDIPSRLLKRWANAIGCIIDDILPDDQIVEKIFDFDENIYGPLTDDLNRLLHYIDESLNRDKEPDDKEPYIKQFRDHVSALKEKPWVVTIGHYDAGKSHFCNFCLETKRLPTDYQPVTKFPTFVRHISDRPKWFQEDVWIMKPGFEPEKWYDEDHCTGHRALAGSWDTLEQYAKVEEGKDNEKGSVLAFSEAPLLHSCVLVDLPGYDTEMTKTNDAVIDEVIRRADILLFFSTINGFLNQGELTCFSALLRNLQPFKKIDDNFPTLGNLFIIASQAHPAIKTEELNAVLNKSSKRFYEHFKESILSKLGYREQQISQQDIRARFFSFYAETKLRRQDLQNNLKDLLKESMPPVWNKRVSDRIHKLKKEGEKIYKRKGEEYDNILEDINKAKCHYKNLKKEQENYDSEMKNIELQILILMDQTIRETQKVFLKKINVKEMTDMITERYKEKEKAQQEAAAYVLEKILSETGKLQDNFIEKVQKFIEEFVQYSEERKNILREDTREVSIPYNEEISIGALGFTGGSLIAGGVAGLGELIGLGGALTILTFGIGASAIMGIATALILIRMGGSWQQRLAREIQKALKNGDILIKIENNIRSVRDTTQKILENYYTEHQKQIEETEEIIDSQESHSELKKKLDHCEKIEDFFAHIPWRRE